MGNMTFSGCQGKPQVQVFEKKCPNCGGEIEIFSIDTEAVCENCGFTIYNNVLSCVQWCKYAKLCVGEEQYRQLKKIAEMQKEER
uniref:Phosphohydrolase n=1 Tax=uncultured bacterium Contig1450 TaxID=1393427 RepID=W0FKY1_9BACT|nr:hypothetical protein [uncultured bacterium Contig1450]